MKAAELREKSIGDLNAELEGLLKKQFDDRMKHAAGQLDKTNEIRTVRRNIARVRTLINEKSRLEGRQESQQAGEAS